uniref:RING-type domain-containing protein n=1 Tax=Globisporangium ultimum (strain ATCC 200006 / CBS 805.95 / DAOM BR144) TaxID=431595 RepID=K3WJ45_GLOUD
MGDCSVLVCPICLDTLAAPVVLSTCCGQSFCRVCLDAALVKVDACPMCREPLLRGGKHAVTRNRALEEIVARLLLLRSDSGKDGDMVSTTAGTRGDDEGHHVLIQILQGAAANEVVHSSSAVAKSVSCRQWRHWCQVHWASLQCVFYVVLFFVFVSFLRVQEEEFAEHQTRH